MKFSAVFGAAVAVFMAASAAQSAVINFFNIAGGDTAGDSLVSRFTLDVSALSTTKVLIKVKSAINSGASYFIGGIFIDDLPGNALGSESTAFKSAYSSTNVRFSYSNSGGDLPQGNNVNFGKTSKFLADNGSGNKWAVQPGETAGFVFDGNLTNVLNAFSLGTLRFGLHVQNLPGCKDGSDSYVTRATPSMPAPVPLPASGLLLLGVVGLAGLRRKR